MASFSVIRRCWRTRERTQFPGSTPYPNYGVLHPLDCIPLFSELYRQVAHDIKGRIANLLDCEKIELTVSLMEAEPERYAAD